MFTARWRWNLNRSLAVLRRKGGRLNPFNIQRMESDDLMAAVFPSLAACQDNAPAGPVEIPDHLLVRETMGDCLEEAMDIEGLEALVRRFEQGTVRLHFIDTVEPSVLAHEILNGAPFTYLDEDTEIGERRSRAVPLRRGLPVEPRELGRLDPDAIERVRAEAAPEVRDPDELQDVLLSLVAGRPRQEWSEYFQALCDAGRAFEVHRPEARDLLWAATERRGEIEALFPGSRMIPDHELPENLARPPATELADDALVALVQGHLDISGPVIAEDLAAAMAIPASSLTIALETLRARGFAISGRFEPERGEQWCARRLLARIHSYTRDRRRAEVRPINQEQWLEFLQGWWHTAPGTRLNGRAGLAEVIEQFQGSSGRPATGRGCSPSGWIPTGPSGWTTCVSRGRSLGAVCRSPNPPPTATIPRPVSPAARAGLRRAGRRSPSCCATTCPGCFRPTGGAPSRRSPPPAAGGRCSMPSARTAPSFTPSCRPAPAACRARSRKASGTG
jgi:ATP-dependent Lhr-like helicase